MSTNTSSTNGGTAAATKDTTSNTKDTTTNNNNIPSNHQLITEGSISMLYPVVENSVFYNPVQVQNRDLSILMIGMYTERRIERLWRVNKKKEIRKVMLNELDMKKKKKGNKGGDTKEKKKETKEERKARLAQFEIDIDAQVELAKKSVDFTRLTLESSKSMPSNGTSNSTTTTSNDCTIHGVSIFEALAASGLRSLRYWKEVPGVRSIIVNDLDPVAVDMARENVGRNGMNDVLVSNDEKDSTSSFALRPHGIKLQVGDATHEMYMSRRPPKLHADQCNPSQLQQKPQYDVIDLDPYGSAAPFIDAAMQSIVNGGLLAITCTDMAALGGSHPETCYGRYGSFPIQRSGYLQELALRILLYHVSIVAGRYGRTIKPVLSVGMAFYCRVFIEVYDDKAGVNNLSLNHGHLFQSARCSSFHVTPIGTNEYVSTQWQQQQNSDQAEGSAASKKSRPSNVYRNGRAPTEECETGSSYKMAGPLWTGPLHDMDVVNDAIGRLEVAQTNNGVNPSGGTPMHPLHTATTLHGLLVSVSEELPDTPLYHLLPTLCQTVNSPAIPMKMFKAALMNAGYRVSAYHKEPQAIKTDAPNHVVWDIVRAYCMEHPPHKKKESKKHRVGEEQGSQSSNYQSYIDIATKILSKEMSTEIDFTIPKGFEKDRKKAKRWAHNPEPNWGPKAAASGKNKRKQEDGESAVEEPSTKQSKP